MKDLIEKKYYSTYQISKEIRVSGQNLQHWLDAGLFDQIKPVDIRNGKRLYNQFQRFYIRRMARLMATGFYTVKGALASIDTDVEVPIVKNASQK